MSFNFPNSPTVGSTYTPAGGPTYTWTGTGWKGIVAGIAPMTGAEILSALAPADGSGSGLDADLLDGQSSAFYATASGLSAKLDASSYTAADVLAKLLTVDGTGSSLDADLLDGQSGAYYLSRANHTGTQASTTITGLGTAAVRNLFVGSSAPGSPAVNDLWVDTT